MSYDFRIGDFSANYTSNVRAMWACRQAPDGIRGLDGKKGVELLFALRSIRDNMEFNQTVVRELEPKNGWGDFDSAYALIGQLILAACRFPNERLSVTC